MNAKPGRKRRLIAEGTVLLVSVLVLSGCGFMHSGRYPVALSVSPRGNLELAVCTDIDVGDFYMSQRSDGEWKRIWEGQGTAEIQNGTVLDFGLDSHELTTTWLSAPDLNGSSEFAVTLLAVDGSGGISAYFPPQDLSKQPAGDWYFTDGSFAQTPCR